MTDLTPAEIAELRRLHEAATPGPWENGNEYDGTRSCRITGPDGLDFKVDYEPQRHFYSQYKDAADLIVAARNALPRLLDENERLRAAVGLEARDRIVSASPGELLIDRNGHQRIRVGLMQEEQSELVRLRAELAEAVLYAKQTALGVHDGLCAFCADQPCLHTKAAAFVARNTPATAPGKGE